MKKLIAGCLIVIAIALVGFAAAGYYAYRWARPMIQNTADYLDRARELSRLGDRIANRSPYVPPPGNELTSAQVERFLAVQARVRNVLGERWSDVETKAAQIRDKTHGNHRELTFAEFTTVLSDLAAIYTEARRAQVEALNTHRFSEAEYAWVRLRVYEAAGMEITGGIDMSKLEQIARDNGVPPADIDRAKISVPQANITLVRPHLASLKQSLPIALLGL